MTIDRKRITAVQALEALGYTWVQGQWHFPTPQQTPPPPLSAKAFELLEGTVRRHMGGYDTPPSPDALMEEIKGWGWFK